MCSKDEHMISCEQEGMTMLDYLAGQALNSMAVVYAIEGFFEHPAFDHVASVCYNLAEAMLVEKHRRASLQEKRGGK